MAVRIEAGKSADEEVLLYKELAQIKGHVIDEEGNPIEGATLYATQTPDRLFDPVEGVSSTDGSYQLEVALGSWSVRATAPNDPASWTREEITIEPAGRRRGCWAYC